MRTSKYTLLVMGGYDLSSSEEEEDSAALAGDRMDSMELVAMEESNDLRRISGDFFSEEEDGLL